MIMNVLAIYNSDTIISFHECGEDVNRWWYKTNIMVILAKKERLIQVRWFILGQL